MKSFEETREDGGKEGRKFGTKEIGKKKEGTGIKTMFSSDVFFSRNTEHTSHYISRLDEQGSNSSPQRTDDVIYEHINKATVRYTIINWK